MADLNFPDSPTDGEIYGNYQWDDTVGVWKLLPAVTPVASVSFLREFLLMGA